ncbi:hypothetical protein B0T14DRAFT_54110 [Immersiella caudata]|uniref:Secreted protein n=1 Tax=Immersiella caudata TaxID=314043 RepID=A0AA39XGY6_9PEZI|nr:hypothetical protein B0T14DRAFT_54110 [Immersiella caudata]
MPYSAMPVTLVLTLLSDAFCCGWCVWCVRPYPSSHPQQVPYVQHPSALGCPSPAPARNSRRDGEAAHTFCGASSHTSASAKRERFSFAAILWAPMREPRPRSQKGCSAGLSSVSLCPVVWPCKPCLSRTLWPFGQGAPGSGLDELETSSDSNFLLCLMNGRALQRLVNANPWHSLVTL